MFHVDSQNHHWGLAGGKGVLLEAGRGTGWGQCWLCSSSGCSKGETVHSSLAGALLEGWYIWRSVRMGVGSGVGRWGHSSSERRSALPAAEVLWAARNLSPDSQVSCFSPHHPAFVRRRTSDWNRFSISLCSWWLIVPAHSLMRLGMSVFFNKVILWLLWMFCKES